MSENKPTDAFAELYATQPNQVFEAKKEDIAPATFEAAIEVPAEVISETTKSEVAPEVEAPKVEKGWLGRSKDAIARSSENFLKRIGAGALEAFDRRVTSRLSAGPKKQIERHQAEIAKNEAKAAALAELIKNTPDSSSSEKAKIQLQKNEERLNSNKAKLEASNEKLNTRNKWQESVLNTRNEFLKNVASNYATVEANQKEKLTPLQAEKANCEAARLNLTKLHETRDADIAKNIANAATYKATMMKYGVPEDEVMKDPAYKEALKQAEVIKKLKVEEDEALKKSEDKVNKKLSDQMAKYNKISKKRKDCEDSYTKKGTAEYEAKASDITEVIEEVKTESTVESNESAPKFSVKSQVEVWNNHVGNNPQVQLDLIEIAARAFKGEGDLLTRDEFISTVKPILLSRGVHPSSIDEIGAVLKATV